MRTRVAKLCITPDQFIQNILLPEKDEMWRHLLQKNFQNRIVRDPSRLAKCQTRRNNGTKSIQASKEMSSYNFQGTFKCFITLLCFNRNPSNVALFDTFWKFIFSLNRAEKWFNSKQNPKYSFKKYSFDWVREILYNYSFKRLWGKSFKIKKKAEKLQSQNSAWYSKVSRND